MGASLADARGAFRRQLSSRRRCRRNDAHPRRPAVGALGQQVVVENKGGAGGNLAHDMVAHAGPDRYTMLMGTNSVPVNPFLFPGLTFDPLTDFAPV
ncbi:MAG: tripartite tricarboxylate transporter substrate-binding protein [Xanthobacteraceae bacterium]